MMRKMFAALAALVLFASSAWAQSQTQFPTSPWGGFAPATVQCGWLYGANMNTTADQVIPIAVPSVNYVIDSIIASAPSTSLTTAVGGIYQAASKAGTAVVANSQAYSTLTSNTANTAGNEMSLTLESSTTSFNLTALYFSLTTPQGAAATMNIRIRCRPLY
jgi:hypothetical protein